MKGQTMTDTQVETREFTIDAPKKTCIKFREDDSPKGNILIGPLYVKKWFVGEAQRVKVTVEVID
jgi:dihydroxyacetone kinase